MGKGRRCVFCGAPKVSKEHVIPSWIQKLLPNPPGSSRMVHEITGGRRTAFETDAYQVKVKRVCRDCNHGWMEREIEKPNQAILPPMFRGQRTDLSPEDQRYVSTWAFKTHLMAQYLHTPSRRPGREQLQWLYENKTPAPKTKVHLAIYKADSNPNEVHHAWGRTHTFSLVPEGPEVGPGDVLRAEMMTLCIGYLVMQVFKWEGPESDVVLDLSPALAKYVIPIWPPGSLTLPWPPQHGIASERDLESFSEAFLNTGDLPQ